MMHPDEKRKLSGLLVVGTPVMGWLAAAKPMLEAQGTGARGLIHLMQTTAQEPMLMTGLIGGAVLGVAGAIALHKAGKTVFQGAEFKRHLRGTKLVSQGELARITKRGRSEQIEVAGVPMPTEVETTHLLINGSTGTGKTVLLNRLVLTGALRRDRFIICDPDADMYSKFGRKRDKLLNPYDARTEGWELFNEIRDPYDYERYAESLIQSTSKEEEEWCGYARLLWRETARQVVLRGLQPGETLMGETARWTTLADVDALHGFLRGTPAESLFVGADKALASARFILSKNLAPHGTMPMGGFSLRDWLEDDDGGNLFITWREGQAPALRPLISTWVDVLCNSVLTMTPSEDKALWVILDELGSLNRLPSLEAAATKGRKHGLRLVAGLQSVSQLDDIYGPFQAQTLRSCFRSLVVLGGASPDPRTAEEMSKSLGEHEVERYAFSTSDGQKGGGTSKQIRHDREPAVMPAEITHLPPLTGYLSFAGGLPVARFKLKITEYETANAAFVKRAL